VRSRLPGARGGAVMWRAGLAAAALAVLASCGVPAKPEKAESATLADLRATAQKANKLSDLQQAAYTRNTLFRFSAAESDYRETLGLARELFPLDPARASSLRLHLALNKSNLGQYDAAEELFRRSRPIVKEIGPVAERAKPDLFYAQHLMNLTLYDRAEPLARDVLGQLDGMIAGAEKGRTLAQAMREPLIQRQDGAILIDQARANLVNARDRIDASVTSQQRILRDYGRLLLQRVHARYVLARAIKAQGKDTAEIDGMVTASEADLAEVPESYGRWLRAEIASLKAEQLVAAGKRPEAIAALDEAIGTLRRYEVNSRPEALLLFRKGEMQIEGGQGAEGQATFREALRIIKEDEQGLEVEQAETLIDQLLIDAQSGDREAQSELFELLQKVRSSATAQTVAQLSARLSSGDTAQANAIRRVQNLEREVNIVSARLDRLEADQSADLHMKRVTEQKLTDTQAELDTARAELAEIAPNFDQLTGTVIPLGEAQAALADGEVMAAIQLGPEKGLVLVLSNVSFEVYEIVVSLATAEEEVRALREPIDGEYLLAFDLDRAHALYRNLFGPATARIEAAKHLVVIPSGPLTSLPFNTLLPAAFEGEVQIAGMETGEPYFDYSQVAFLGRQTAITTGVSISSFFLGRRVPASQATRPFRGFGDFAAFGADEASVIRISRDRELADSCFDSVRALGQLNELGGTRDELNKIAAILNVSGEDEVLGAAFTDSAVKAMPLEDYRVLHFATHGLLAQSPECLPEPGLVTSLAADGDALLEASEIVDLHLDAELVVMSACDTSAGAGVASEALTGFRGVGGSYAAGGESLNGLARSFFYAGARNVVSSYWSVDDIATQELMVGFYGAAAADPEMGIAEAMRLAEEAQIAGGKHSHPFFWAPFATIGDGARSLRLTGGGATASLAKSGTSGT